MSGTKRISFSQKPHENDSRNTSSQYHDLFNSSYHDQLNVKRATYSDSSNSDLHQYHQNGLSPPQHSILEPSPPLLRPVSAPDLVSAAPQKQILNTVPSVDVTEYLDFDIQASSSSSKYRFLQSASLSANVSLHPTHHQPPSHATHQPHPHHHHHHHQQQQQHHQHLLPSCSTKSNASDSTFSENTLASSLNPIHSFSNNASTANVSSLSQLSFPSSSSLSSSTFVDPALSTRIRDSRSDLSGISFSFLGTDHSSNEQSEYARHDNSHSGHHSENHHHLLLPPPSLLRLPSLDDSARETFHGFISNLDDALLVVEAARIGLLPRVTRRFTENERNTIIKHGSIFVYEENQASIRRWNDDRRWTSSRIYGCFLLYREIVKDKSSPQLAQPMMKKTLSIYNGKGDQFRLISYYLKNQAKQAALEKPRFNSALSQITVPKDYYQIADGTCVNFGDIPGSWKQKNMIKGKDVGLVQSPSGSPGSLLQLGNMDYIQPPPTYTPLTNTSRYSPYGQPGYRTHLHQSTPYLSPLSSSLPFNSDENSKGKSQSDMKSVNKAAYSADVRQDVPRQDALSLNNASSGISSSLSTQFYFMHPSNSQANREQNSPSSINTDHDKHLSPYPSDITFLHPSNSISPTYTSVSQMNMKNVSVDLKDQNDRRKDPAS